MRTQHRQIKVGSRTTRPRQNKITRFLLGGIAAMMCLAAGPAIAATSAELRREENGCWLYLNGVRTPPWSGIVYQPTEGARHIHSYSNSMASLYGALDDEAEGGKSHGSRLSLMGIQAIRVYELPVENAEDAQRVKEVFRRLFMRHRIRVLVGDWVGLHSGADFSDPVTRAGMVTHLRRLVATYAEEPWLLGWQLGNENNYHIKNGQLSSQIDLGADAYYQFMDQMAGAVKAELGARGLHQFVALGQGDLTEAEAQRIGAMKHIDAVGINWFRKKPAEVTQLIATATNRFAHLPVYFAEVGYSADSPDAELQQADYLQQVSAVIYSHAAGRLRSGCVMGAFIHEATDQFWKRQERGAEADAHFGVLGKTSEAALRSYLRRQNDFFATVVPPNEGPDKLIEASWRCLGLSGDYTKKHGRDYGNAMAYSTRVIELYRGTAEQQQTNLLTGKPTETWALDAVGTGYFILGFRWMLQAYDLQGMGAIDGQTGLAHKAKLLLRDAYRGGEDFTASTADENPATSAPACMRYARDVFAELLRRYPLAKLNQTNGKQFGFAQAVQARFPELSPPYISCNWRNATMFTAAGLSLMLGLSWLARRNLRLTIIQTERVMGPAWSVVFLLAFILYLLSLFLLLTWWFHPVRLRFYTVQPVLYWSLTLIAIGGMVFYFVVWLLMWSMRRPQWLEPDAGSRVALVTTRVASEAPTEVEATLERMNRVRYPHDSFLLDEENNVDAKWFCGRHHVTHFSRKGQPHYNTPTGIFQARTKGGNLNSWLYEHGRNYDFVTFLDPDHAPHPEFLDRVLGYFKDPKVAFVQAPHVFVNRERNWIARGAAEQSYFFCGPIMMGLFGIGACVVNGSHSTFRVKDLLAMKENAYAVHDADDILTSVRLNALGKIGVYVPEILAEGLVPENWEEFSKQQRRWAASMFNLLVHYFPTELRRVPWPAKVVYLMLALFYLLAAAFFVLLLTPFISLMLGNPPVNADIVAFCCHYLPFLAMHTVLLRFIGQPFLIGQASRRGFWIRAGILWLASWWDFLRALMQGVSSGRVKPRVVASKWGGAGAMAKLSVLPHLMLCALAVGSFALTLADKEKFETTFHQGIFLGVIFVSQGLVAFRLWLKPKLAPVKNTSQGD